MRFTFPFETLLNMKRNLEELSQMRLAKKMAQLRELEDEIQRIIGEILSNGQSLRGKIEQGMRASEYIVYKLYEQERYETLQAREESRKQAIKEVEAEQQILIQLMKERKMYERLRERQWKKFQYDMERLDQKNNDEMVITRYHSSPKIGLS